MQASEFRSGPTARLRRRGLSRRHNPLASPWHLSYAVAVLRGDLSQRADISALHSRRSLSRSVSERVGESLTLPLSDSE